MDLGIGLLIIVVCLLVEAFFSGSELGIVSVDPMELRHQAAKGSRGAKLTLEMLKKPEWLLATTLVGTNIAVVMNTTVATALARDLLGDAWVWVAIVIIAPLIWVLGEIVPKSVFQQKANTITPKAIFLLRGASILFYPILTVFSAITRVLTRMAGTDRRNPFTMKEELLTMLQMSGSESDIQPMEKTMIQRLFDFRQTTVHEIMVPLVDVAAIEESSTCGDAVRFAVERAHKRLPVYRQRVDQVVGLLDTLNLLGIPGDEPIAHYVNPVEYVPASKSISDLFSELRQAHRSMAVVVDEFGGAEGIVTIEDIMEEVVEDIRDEFDEEEGDSQWIRKLGEHHYLVSARVEIDTIQEKLSIELPKGRYATLSGFLLELARDVPEVGQIFQYRDLTFTIHSAAPQVVEEVRIQW